MNTTSIQTSAGRGRARAPGRPRTTAKDRLFHLSTSLHRRIFRATKGRVLGRAMGMPVAELVTVGRRTGRERATMLAVPVLEADRLVLVASFGGDDRHPAWFLNLRANPSVRVTVAGSTRRPTARVATGAERAALWSRIVERYAGYARYQQRTERELPIVVLEGGRQQR
ncbi:nitroreductase/quinone reductase family protein [Actinocatenispora sera]